MSTFSFSHLTFSLLCFFYLSLHGWSWWFSLKRENLGQTRLVLRWEISRKSSSAGLTRSFKKYWKKLMRKHFHIVHKTRCSHFESSKLQESWFVLLLCQFALFICVDLQHKWILSTNCIHSWIRNCCLLLVTS